MRLRWALALLILLPGCSKKQEEFIVGDDLTCSLRQLLNDSDFIVEGTLASYDPDTRIGGLQIHQTLRGRSPTPEARLDFSSGIPMPTPSIKRHLIPGVPLLWLGSNSASVIYLNRFFMLFYPEGDAKTGKWNYSVLEGGMNKTFNGSLPKLASLIRDVLSGNVPGPVFDPNLKPITAADLRALPAWGEPVDEEYLPHSFRKGNPPPLDLRPPEKPADLVPGLRTTTFQGPWSEPPKFDVLEPLEKSVADSLSLGTFPTTESLRVRFQGYLDIPKDGVYVFTLAGDAQSTVSLAVGTTDVVSVSRDSAKECGGDVALKAGKHLVRLTCAVLERERKLQVFWSGPGFTRQPIPAKAFFHEP
jgi:hypothetical protein